MYLECLFLVLYLECLFLVFVTRCTLVTHAARLRVGIAYIAFLHVCLCEAKCVVCFAVAYCSLVCLPLSVCVCVCVCDDWWILTVESKHTSKKKEGQWILSELLLHRNRQLQAGGKENTFRIGLTGSPGSGKSTYIEHFGQFLTSKEHKVAVLVSQTEVVAF